VVPLPDHDDFRDTGEHRRKRTMLFASNVPIDLFGQAGELDCSISRGHPPAGIAALKF
jgi:hypothetical protein